jgi:hypothetical protein
VSDPPFDLREVADESGGICLELHAEGHRISTARARGDALADLGTLGFKRADTRALLEAALTRDFSDEQAKVELAVPRPAGSGDGSNRSGVRFVSHYVHRGAEALVVGAVWYDSSSNTTGPDGVPPIVRSKMRTAVQRKLAEKRPTAWRFVVELLDGMSS